MKMLKKYNKNNKKTVAPLHILQVIN